MTMQYYLNVMAGIAAATILGSLYIKKIVQRWNW